MENGIMSQIKTSGSLKLFWISVDPSRHGIMLGAFGTLDEGEAEIRWLIRNRIAVAV